MMFLIRFWRNLTKKDSVESDKYEINKFSTCTVLSVLGRFFMDPDFSGFMKKIGRKSGSGLRKKRLILLGIRKKTRIRNTDIYTSRHATSLIRNVVQLFYLCMQSRQCKLFKLDFMYRTGQRSATGKTSKILISVAEPKLFNFGSTFVPYFLSTSAPLPYTTVYACFSFKHTVLLSKWSELDQVINRPGALSPRQTVELYTNCRTFLREANRMCRSVWVDFNLQVWR